MAHLIDNILHVLQPFIIATALAAWVVAAFGLFRRVRRTPPELRVRESVQSQWARTPRYVFVAGAIFIGIIMGELLLIKAITIAAMREIAPRLTARIEWVSVDGTQMNDATALVGALRAMHGTIGHHSHPTRKYHVVLNTERGDLRLELGRDSGDPHEYWVFYSGFHATRSNAVGHAFTDALDKY